MNTRVKGFFYERDLARRLWKYGFAVIRAPASGSRAKHLKYPDLVAIYKGRVLAIEVKTTRGEKPVYIRGEQLSKLLSFSLRAGAEPYIAVKFIGSGEWVFVTVDKLTRLDSGGFKLDVDDVENGISLNELVKRVKEGVEGKKGLN